MLPVGLVIFPEGISENDPALAIEILLSLCLFQSALRSPADLPDRAVLTAAKVLKHFLGLNTLFVVLLNCPSQPVEPSVLRD